VVGLDGIAVVVHPNNAIRALTLDQLARIYDGEITDWASVGGAVGPITLYARDDNSGTFDTFKHLVLGKRKLAATATRMTDSEKLSDGVAGDVGAIGFIGLAYVRSAKAVAIADQGATPTLPSAFTVTTESYLLSRRLFFYVPARPSTNAALELVSFALSAEGQSIVRASGFIDLGVGMRDVESCTTCSAHYVAATSGARRLSVDFRFRSGSNALDSRATRDVDRLVVFLRAHPGGRLRLLGFSDGNGDAASNLAISRDRAKSVADELETRGVHAAVVDGFGAERPVATNDDEHGREKNRRVEAWLEVDGA
jgi:phosphate transport system substrate-binding protein